jgi:transcriptional/translational regulatory protein YebC/TACO1
LPLVPIEEISKAIKKGESGEEGVAVASVAYKLDSSDSD